MAKGNRLRKDGLRILCGVILAQCVSLVYAGGTSGDQVNAKKAAELCVSDASTVLGLDADERGGLVAAIQNAFIVAKALPDEKETLEISDEVRQQARRWQLIEREADFKSDFAQSMSAMVYERMTKPPADKQQDDLAAKQVEEILELMRTLPERLLTKYGVPAELKEKVDAECLLGNDDVKELLTCEYLRMSQLPSSSENQTKIKEEMENEIDRLGRSLSYELQKNIQEWEADRKRHVTTMPEDLGPHLLDNQLRTTRMYLTSFFGMAVRVVVQKRTLEALHNGVQLTPSGIVSSFETRYKLKVGWIVKIRERG